MPRQTVSMYERDHGARNRDRLEEPYGIKVSSDLISRVTDAVLETVAEWQGYPLDTCYPLIFFDTIRVKTKHLNGLRKTISLDTVRC